MCVIIMDVGSLLSLKQCLRVIGWDWDDIGICAGGNVGVVWKGLMGGQVWNTESRVEDLLGPNRDIFGWIQWLFRVFRVSESYLRNGCGRQNGWDQLLGLDSG